MAPPEVVRESPPAVLAPRPDTFPRPQRLVVFAPPAEIKPPPVYADDWAMSWHLSVINGGHPPGPEGSAEVMRGVGATDTAGDWGTNRLRRGRWYVGNLDGELRRLPDWELGYPGGTGLVGDFNGDGQDEPVLFIDGQWFVDLNGNGVWDDDDLWIRLGTPWDRPVIGDWDGDGKDDVGIFGRQWERDIARIRRDPGLPDPDNRRRRHWFGSQEGEPGSHPDSPERFAARPGPGRAVGFAHFESPTATDAAAGHAPSAAESRERWLRRGAEGTLRADAVDHVFQYGRLVDVPLAGDWNGDGIDQIGVFRGGRWMLDLDGDGRWTDRDAAFDFGQPGDEPVVGDFNGDGIDQIGVVRGDVWIIDTDGDRRLTANDLHVRLPRPSPDAQPVVGDFEGNGIDRPGYFVSED